MFLTFLLPLIDIGRGPAHHRFALIETLSSKLGEVSEFIGTRNYFDPDDREPCGPSLRSLAGTKQRGVTFPQPQEIKWHELTLDDLQEFTRDVSMLSRFRSLIFSDRPALVQRLFEIIAKARDERGLQGVITWVNCASLESACRIAGVPCIHLEQGSLRAPVWFDTMFVDFRGVNGRTSFFEIAEAVVSGDEQVPSFSFEELRDLLAPSGIPNRVMAKRRERYYPLGIPLQVELDSNLIAFSDVGTTELIAEVFSRCAGGYALIRQHPLALARYNRLPRCTIDHSDNSVEFIGKCKRILTINSSVGVEAMLMERDVEFMGRHPARDINLWSSDEKNRLRLLIAYCLGYLVPRPLAFDPSYLRWRIGRPSIGEIINTNLNWYLNNRS